MDKQRHDKQRFLDRIWHTIYRKKLKCPCDMCQNEKVVVLDTLWASHLYDCQNEMNIEYSEKPIVR